MCGPSCSNRACFVECTPGQCRFGESCTNMRFQKKQGMGVEVRHTGTGKGYGLFATEDIPADAFIIEYVGELLSDRMFQIRKDVYSMWNQKRVYFMSLAGKEAIDANFKGNESRFCNHSCDPNADIQKWRVLSECRIGFFAAKDIRSGEEITLNYNFQRYAQTHALVPAEPPSTSFLLEG